MRLLDKVKSVLGRGADEQRPPRESTAVTVEYEPDAENEAAVKGVDDTAAAGTDASAGSTTGDDEDEAAESVPEGDDETGTQQVTAISGIGTAYADRLADAGVETVADLAEADPAALAEATDISETRLRRWVDDAAETR